MSYWSVKMCFQNKSKQAYPRQIIDLPLLSLFQLTAPLYSTITNTVKANHFLTKRMERTLNNTMCNALKCSSSITRLVLWGFLLLQLEIISPHSCKKPIKQGSHLTIKARSNNSRRWVGLQTLIPTSKLDQNSAQRVAG